MNVLTEKVALLCEADTVFLEKCLWWWESLGEFSVCCHSRYVEKLGNKIFRTLTYIRSDRQTDRRTDRQVGKQTERRHSFTQTYT